MSTSLSCGQVVETFDRHVLGTIREIDGERLLLEPGFGRSFWIPSGLVRTIGADRVRLHIDKKRLGRYRQPSRREPEVFPRKAPVQLMWTLAASVLAAGVWIVL